MQADAAPALPRIILVGPRGGANVGSVCRAMANMGAAALVTVDEDFDVALKEGEEICGNTEYAIVFDGEFSRQQWAANNELPLHRIVVAGGGRLIINPTPNATHYRPSHCLECLVVLMK